jgi:hypothetical protein
MKADARYRQRDIRTVFRTLTDDERSRFLLDVIGVGHVCGWLAMHALDSQRRQVADTAFAAMEAAIQCWREAVRGVAATAVERDQASRVPVDVRRLQMRRAGGNH